MHDLVEAQALGVDEHSQLNLLQVDAQQFHDVTLGVRLLHDCCLELCVFARVQLALVRGSLHRLDALYGIAIGSGRRRRNLCGRLLCLCYDCLR